MVSEHNLSAYAPRRRRQCYRPREYVGLPLEVVELNEIIGRHVADVDLVAAFDGRRGPPLHIVGAVS